MHKPPAVPKRLRLHDLTITAITSWHNRYAVPDRIIPRSAGSASMHLTTQICHQRKGPASPCRSIRYAFTYLFLDIVECTHSSILCGLVKEFFQSEELVVLGDTVSSRQGTCLDLTCIETYNDICDSSVFCLTASV